MEHRNLLLCNPTRVLGLGLGIEPSCNAIPLACWQGASVPQPLAMPYQSYDKTVPEYLGDGQCPVTKKCKDTCGHTPRRQLISAFKAFDRNRNGIIERSEADSQLLKNFRDIDQDFNGVIEFKEVCAYETYLATHKYWRDEL